MILKDRIALVSGASRGIGRGIAVALAQAGADVVVNHFGDDSEAHEVADTIRKLGRRVLIQRVDVSDQTAVERMVADTVAEFGRLDIAVTNAVFSDREPFVDAAMSGFRRTIDVTMWGAFYIVRAAAQQMIRQGGGGSIVAVSSPHAFIPVPNSMAYNMAKAATDSMVRTAAIELVSQRIRVNMVHPGWIDTPGERKFASEEQIVKAGAKLPWGRLGRADEVARGVVFLCDPASDYITGNSIGIDGGNTLPWWASGGMAVPQ